MVFPLFSIDPIFQKGKGVVATSDIPKGTLLVAEPPLLEIMGTPSETPTADLLLALAQQLWSLSEDQQRTYLSLAHGALAFHPHDINLVPQDNEVLGRLLAIRLLDRSLPRAALLTRLKEENNWSLSDGRLKRLMEERNLQTRPARPDQPAIAADVQGNEAAVILGIFVLNARTWKEKSRKAAVFPSVARFNHSCSCNASDSWHQATGEERIFANRDIKQGEEICVDYFPTKIWIRPRAARQRYIRGKYNFDCCCDTCNLTGKQRAASNRRRRRFRELYKPDQWQPYTDTDPGRLISCVQELLILLRDEGETGIQFYNVMFLAFQFCILHGDMARASKFMEMGVRRRILCQGEDYDEREMEDEWIRDPLTREGTPHLSTLWATQVGDAPGEDDDGFVDWLWARI